MVRKVVRKKVAAPVKKATMKKGRYGGREVDAPVDNDNLQPKGGAIERKTVVLAETLETTPIRGKEKTKVKLDGGYRQMPFDMPMYIEVTRLLNTADGAVEGYVVSLDCFTYGRTVHVRIGKQKGWRKGHSPETTAKDPDKMKIWVNKKKVYEGAHDDADNRFKNGDE